MDALDVIPQVRAAKIAWRAYAEAAKLLALLGLIAWVWWIWHGYEARGHKVDELNARVAAVEASQKAQAAIDAAFNNMIATQRLRELEAVRAAALDDANTREATTHDAPSADFARLHIPQRLRDADAATRARARLDAGRAAGAPADHPQ